MQWTELKLHEEWEVHLAANDRGESNGCYIIKHLKCPDGGVLPGIEPLCCTECGTQVPATVLKRLPFIINRDKLIN
jgi:hypothetical protein